MAAMHAHANAGSALGLPASRLGSGTSWLPDSTTLRARSGTAGAWMLMFSGRAFAQYVQQGSKRGDRQFGLTDWEMLMAMRNVGRGALRLTVMTSVESAVLGGSGYPSLLQTGGSYRHAHLHDRQHPHPALMELSAAYERPLGSRLAFTAYLAAVGEPALGPVASMHRPSAQGDPMASIGHHWQDVTHQSFGVATVGVQSRTFRLEASAFNPREADEHHLVADYRDARLDSYAGRISWAPNAHVVASSWWGFLNSHDRLDPTARMHRYGGSVITEARGVAGGRWSSTLVWAMNLHHHGDASHAIIHGGAGASPHHHASSMLAETNVGIGTRTSVFARAESVRKNGEELGFLGGDLTELYDIRSYSIGGTRDLATVAGARVALGARAALHFVPSTLLATYGTRRPMGFAVYAVVR